VWKRSIETWCKALGTAYPAFRCRFAANGEEPNVWYTDHDRGIMDIGRIEHDAGFRVQYPMLRAYEDFLRALCKKTPA
jgi:hypothetical protein